MKVSYRAPGSCGEFIQGFINSEERLISMPIDIYSTVTIKTGRGIDQRYEGTKALQVLKLFLEIKGIDHSALEDIEIDISSNLPIAKGMASSTADMLGMLYCARDFFKTTLTKDELIKMCCKIEPTDSTIFNQVTLFDHINGKYHRHFKQGIAGLKVMILEMDGCVDTIGFRKSNHNNIQVKNHVDHALLTFEEGLNKGDYTLIGKACTMSARANQSRLYKPLLEEIIAIALDGGAYGVNVAHSGTVVGILYDDTATDIDRLNRELSLIKAFDIYSKTFKANIIRGGVQKVLHPKEMRNEND